MLFESNPKSPKVIKGLSFKDILDEGERTNSPKENVKDYSFFKKVFWEIQKYVFLISTKLIVFRFLVEFLRYLVNRSRVTFTILTVITELFSVYFDSSKRFFVNRLFWGRGKFLKFTAQFLAILLLLFTFVSYTYKTATFESAEHGFQNVYAAQHDILIQSASTNTQVPHGRNRMTSEEYTVKVGDTLGKIAEDYRVNVDTILWANDLTERAIISPGDVLEIPPGNGLNVKVQSGETLESLAKKYESNPQMIIDLNWSLEYPYELQLGQELFIPDGKKPEPAKPVAPVYSGIIRQRAGQISSSPSVPGVGRFLHWPVQGGGGRLLQCYTGWHNGIDISGGVGTNLVAAAPGTVTFAGCQSGGCPPLGSMNGGWGLAWTVVVDHGNGLSSVYGHMRNFAVSTGQSVTTGQVLGEMGATGTAYGLHIHFMVLQGGSWRGVNPAQYMVNSLCGY